jgi:hypothetical protein
MSDLSPHDTITFAMLGEVTLDDLHLGLGRLRECLSALERDCAGGRGVAWRLEQLEKSSAIATFAGNAQRPGGDRDVSAIVSGYEAIGRGLELGNLDALPPASAAAARNLVALIRGDVTGLRLESDQESFEALASPALGALPVARLAPAWGEVRGRVQSMSNRRGLRFTIYETRNDRPVTCHLPRGFEEKMRDAWGKEAVVSGRVKRHPATGMPISVADVRDVVLTQGVAGDWRDAMGCLKPLEGEAEPAEATIRRSRDAW